MLRIVERSSRLCFIGSSNPRSDRDTDIMTYFE
jgi:hypothetical protein